MKKSALRIFVIAVLVVVGVLAWQLWGPAVAPFGQPELLMVSADNYGQIRTAFNDSTGKVRVVALLSPT